MKKALFAVLIIVFSLAPIVTSANPAPAALAPAQPGSVLINEFIATPTGSEAVELCNPTGSAIDVGGWTIDGAAINAGQIVPAGGYLILTTANVPTLGISNAGEVLELVDTSATTIDQVGYGNSGSAPKPEYGFSAARVADCTDTDDDAADFNTDETPTLGAANDGPAAALGSTTVTINEVDAHAGSAFVELYNSGGSAVDLSGWRISVDDSYDIPADQSIPAGGFWVLDEANFPPYFYLDASGDNVYLFDNTLARVDQVGWSTDAGTGNSWNRVPDGNGPNDGYNDATSMLVAQAPTNNATNGGLDYTPIYDIQYTTDPSGDSPYVDQTVTTEGIVTARFQYGYFIEDPAGGAWNGLWVYDSNTPALGDRVRLTGTVMEYYNLTELGSLTAYTVESSGNPIPGPEVLATGDVSQEQWEGVMVRVETVTVTNDNLGNGEWSVSDSSGDVRIDDKGTYTYAPTTGAAIDAIIGPLDYTYSDFKIQPRDDNDIIVTAAPDWVINEIHADPDSTLGDANGDGAADYSNDEFVEIVNVSGGDVDISDWTLADGAEVRHTFPAGTVVAAQCTIVVFGGGTPTGDFGGAVVQTASSGALGLNNSGDTVTLNDGTIDQATATYGADGDDNQSLTLDPDITGTAFVKHSLATGSGGALFSPGTMIDGSPFSGCMAAMCGGPATFIHDVQGDGLSSPLNGTAGVIVEGVVVGDFQDTATELKGFFLQEEDSDADANPLTSEGVFVYDDGLGVDVIEGDVVRVLGNVTEYYGLTELNSVGSVVVCSSGASVVASAINLPVADIDDLEPYEGMLVTFPQTLYATETYDLGRYGEVVVSVNDRLYNPTNVVLPGAPALALQDLNDRSRILIDDASTVQNPPVVPYLAPDNTLRLGDTVTDLTGALSYDHDYYRVMPTVAPAFVRDNERTATPPDAGGTLKVASFNVLNYFNGDGLGGGFPTSRGANTLVEFNRQREKIVAAILAIDPDIVGLMEIENDGYGAQSAIQDLVNGLNDIAGAGTYAFIDPGVLVIGTDEIAVGLLYKPATVTPVGAAAILDSSVDPDFLDDKNRPALAQTFDQNATGERFTVVVNHLKSKGSACDDVGDPDTGDGQGNCNLTRTEAAIAEADWLATDPTGSGDADFLIIGDLNSYALEDPITALKAAGYTDLLMAFDWPDAYSYVYFGQAGYLDHALASAHLKPQVASAKVWHINADEPRALDYNDDILDSGESTSTINPPYVYSPDAYRSSDHDPVVIYLGLKSTWYHYLPVIGKSE